MKKNEMLAVVFTVASAYIGVVRQRALIYAHSSLQH